MKQIQGQTMEKRCVLIGTQGAGKTRLFNEICSQNEKSDQSMESNTKMIAQSQSVLGYGFHLQDTPGFGSYDESVLTHSIGILAALTDGPIHRIILVVEYQQRIDVLKSQIQDTIDIVQEYHQIISIIITHKDKCKIPVNEYYNKAKEMIKKSFEVQSVYFSGNDTNCEDLCSFIDQALLDNGEIINIQDSKFDKMMQGYIDNVLKQAKEEFYNKFQEFYKASKFFLDNFQSEIDDSQQILHYFTSFVRNKSAEIQSDFEKNYGPFMEELNQFNNDPVKAYYYHSVLKHSISEQVQELIKGASKKMKYPEDHPYMQLRRCSQCGTIWLKVAGCDGITRCGNRPKKYQTDVLITSLFNIYKFHLTNNSIEYTVIQDQPQYTNSQIQFVQKITQDLISQYSELEEFFSKINQDNFENINQLIQNVAEYIISPTQSQNAKRDKKQANFLIFQNAKNELKKKLVEQNHKNQIKNGGQIGCGFYIDWQNAPLVDIIEIDTDQVQILESLSKGNLIYQEQFHIHKQKLVIKAQQEKKILTQN